MKMKVQKANFKKVILLLLLLSGSMGFSFPAVQAVAFEDQQEQLVTAEVSEQVQDLRDGSLPGITVVKSSLVLIASSISPYLYLSLGEAKTAAAYIRFSRNIDPALDAPNIIYPFHSFL